MPTSVTDRLTTTYDDVFLLVRSPRYYFDLAAIREPLVVRKTRHSQPVPGEGTVVGKNPGDVWTTPGATYPGAHFATFPADLVRRPILAGCPEFVCTACGSAWKRSETTQRIGERAIRPRDRFVRRYPARWRTLHAIGPLVACGCGAPTRPGLVLDPFFGTGTVGEVARFYGRDWLGIELNPTYIRMAWERLDGRARRAA